MLILSSFTWWCEILICVTINQIIIENWFIRFFSRFFTIRNFSSAFPYWFRVWSVADIIKKRQRIRTWEEHNWTSSFSSIYFVGLDNAFDCTQFRTHSNIHSHKTEPGIADTDEKMCLFDFRFGTLPSFAVRNFPEIMQRTVFDSWQLT